MDIPPTKYAKTADGVHVAYQVIGDGPIDLLFAFGWLSNVDATWSRPEMVSFFKRLASFSRLIVFDRRGSGLSDRVGEGHVGTLEAGMDDIGAVMEAAGSERALLFGFQDGGMLCALFAASFPERTAGLVLFGSAPRGLWAADYPWGWTETEWDDYLDALEQGWGSAQGARDHMGWMSPSVPSDDPTAESYAAYFRASASPGAVLAIERMLRDSDVRAVLPSIQVPTLVVHNVDDPVEPVGQARYVADSIPGAELTELPFAEHAPFWESSKALLDTVEGFAVKIRAEEAEFDRVLATVLFTDIVGSTERAAELGDRGWKELLERHHATVRAMLARYRGVEVDTAGDGFFATFDGPARAIRCAEAIIHALGPLGLSIRSGVHTGEVGTIDGKAGGIAVVIGARVGALAGPSEVLVSQTVKDLTAGSGLTFEDAGEHELKGVPDRWRLYRVK